MYRQSGENHDEQMQRNFPQNLSARDTRSEGESVAQLQRDWRSKVLGIDGGSSDFARVSIGDDEARFKLHASDEMSRGLGHSAETPRFILSILFPALKGGRGLGGRWLERSLL